VLSEAPADCGVVKNSQGKERPLIAPAAVAYVVIGKEGAEIRSLVNRSSRYILWGRRCGRVRFPTELRLAT
jgi:hypothetical protein